MTRLFDPVEVARWFPNGAGISVFRSGIPREHRRAANRVYYLIRKGVLAAFRIGWCVRVMPPQRIVGHVSQPGEGKNPLGATDEQLLAWCPFVDEYFKDLPVQLTSGQVARALHVPRFEIPGLRLPFYSPGRDEEVLLLRSDFVRFVKSCKIRPF